jgi:hypothetical protein
MRNATPLDSSEALSAELTASISAQAWRQNRFIREKLRAGGLALLVEYTTSVAMVLLFANTRAHTIQTSKILWLAT